MRRRKRQRQADYFKNRRKTSRQEFQRENNKSFPLHDSVLDERYYDVIKFQEDPYDVFDRGSKSHDERRKLINDRRLWDPYQHIETYRDGRRHGTDQETRRSDPIPNFGGFRDTGDRVRAVRPDLHSVCVKRRLRRRLLFTKGKAGKGIRGPRKRLIGPDSYVKC